MNRRNIDDAFKKLLLIGAALGAAARPALAQTHDPAAEEALKGVHFEQRLGAQLALDSSLVDEQGQPHRFQEYLDGKPFILVFSYNRCPNLCTLVLNGLVEALRGMPELLGASYEVYSVSIDPHEQPRLAAMKRRTYLARYGRIAESGHRPWIFLTGPDSEVRKLALSAGFHYRLDPLSGEYSHPSGILVVTPDGRISQYFLGIQFDSRELQAALKRSLRAKIGTWADEILLFCFHYDPKTSKNGVWVMAAVRAIGALGALSLAVFLLYLFAGRRPKGANAEVKAG